MLDTFQATDYCGAVQPALRATRVVAVLFFIGFESCSSEVTKRFFDAERKGIDFLAANQKETGGFETYEWRELYPDRKRTINSPFAVSQIVLSLSSCEQNPVARKIREKAAAYLLDQENEPGIWRHQGKRDRVPPDVEDTALAWLALRGMGQSIPAEAVKIVLSSRNQAGLFNTWMGDPTTWAHIDSTEIDTVININTLWFLQENGEKADNVCDYLGRLVENDDYRKGSLYYPSPWAFTYAFSRARAGGVHCLDKSAGKIREMTLSLQQSDGGWGNDYETALALLTLLNGGERGKTVDRGINQLVSRQGPDGGWKFETIYSGAPRSGAGRFLYGSRPYITALCVEALAKYRQR